MKRICLFAGYNHGNVVSQYVLDYLQELAQYGDVYYLADGELLQEQMQRLSPFVKGAWSLKHDSHVFYAWKLLIDEYVGWDVVCHYDEMILVNDHCFCVNSLGPVFEKMDAKDGDIWNLLPMKDVDAESAINFENYIKRDGDVFHAGMNFLAIRKNFFSKPYVKKFFDDILIDQNRIEICVKYEFGIFKLAFINKHNIAAYCEPSWRGSAPSMREVFTRIKNGFPLLNVRIFTDDMSGHANMEKLSQVAPFCKKDVLRYAEDVHRERIVSVPASSGSVLRGTEKRGSDAFSALRKIGSAKTYKPFLKRLSAAMLPAIVRDFFYNITHYKSINNANKTRFSCKRRPKGRGWFPEHIYDYERIQKERIAKLGNPESVVVFFNVMCETMSGGMLSIDRFVRFSAELEETKNITVVTSNIPLNNACINNPFFSYYSDPVDFRMMSKSIRPQKMLLNIPECFVPVFIRELTADDYMYFSSIPDFRINILNQNDELMPSQYYVEELKMLCDNRLTMTAAHKRYATQEKSCQYNCPLYLLKPFLPKFYERSFEEKEKVIVLSPDRHPCRKSIIENIKKSLPEYKLVVVTKMPFEEYKNLISKARYAISFGEGWDGYFLEPYLSSSMAFTVRNPSFFPVDFSKDMPTVYDGYEEMANNIIRDMKKYEDKNLYESTQRKVRFEIEKFINNDESLENLKSLYERFNSPRS